MASGAKTPIASSKCKSVFLHEWWLIKVEEGESKLGVGGFVSRETFGARQMRLFGSASCGKRQNNDADYNGVKVFGSAAIAKRHDSNTLEAVDGIIIRICGDINRSRTLSNGFSLEVCDDFLTGFPCSWENYASKYSHDKCDDTTEQSSPMSFDGLPIAHVRDLLLLGTESHALTSYIFRDILKHTEKFLNQDVQSVENISKNSIEGEVDHNQDDDALSNPTQKRTEEDDGLKSDDMHKITQEKQSKELPRRYALRSKRKGKTLEVDD
ncbi:hypothetical protein M8C21_004371 [Ambrosia artemisiifolia]|uniref:SANTA domain-containing protein n=1 Tax=Ambrosia artemisiifolia TaxID=4212 RepID=A0AAD5G9R3_AMBAR|nr:hypothetical protein M8C21_004371 [Ambrosia artemisiifolia]